jgi:hypothetical protein
VNACPSWCEWDGHRAALDPHRASIGTICAPGFEAEMVVRQYEPMGRVTPPIEVVLTLDTTTAAGRVTGCHTVAVPLPADVDMETFLAESDHEPPPATTVIAPGITFEPYRHRPPQRPGGQWRVDEARKALARAQAAADDESRPYEPAEHAGRLQVAVENLLAHVEEQAAQLAAARFALTVPDEREDRRS